MEFKIQNASVTKRIAAFVLDLILLAVLATGGMLAVSTASGYDNRVAELEAHYDKYAVVYGIETFDITQNEYQQLSQEEKDRYDAAFEALNNDEDALRVYSVIMNLSLLIPSLGILFAYIVLEFIVPLVLHNGQTAGKKIFGLAVIRCDGVKASTLMLFARTLLGKFTVETMLPILFIVMNGVFGLTGLIVIGLIFVLDLVLLIATKHRTVIHDAFAQTVVVDLPTQLIFDTPEELTEYKARKAAEAAAAAEYK